MASSIPDDFLLECEIILYQQPGGALRVACWTGGSCSIVYE
jgi:hypothetical protein